MSFWTRMICKCGFPLVYCACNKKVNNMKIVWGILEPLEEYKKIANKFNNKIKELTNGELEVEVKLFAKDPENPLKEIEEGRLDMYQVVTNQLKQITNQNWLKAWEVPFLFKSDAHVEKYIESKEAKEKLKTLETDALLPLAYSYAGGFCAVVSKRGKPKVDNFNDLNTIEFAKYEYENMSVDDFLINIYQYLPSNILMYEINELLKLKPEAKAFLNVDVSKHFVIARVTMLSKDMLAKIPSQYKDVFLTTLNTLLQEERQVIYQRSEDNIKALKADKEISVNGHFTSDEDLNKEIKYITSLVD